MGAGNQWSECTPLFVWLVQAIRAVLKLSRPLDKLHHLRSWRNSSEYPFFCDALPVKTIIPIWTKICMVGIYQIESIFWKKIIKVSFLWDVHFFGLNSESWFWPFCKWPLITFFKNRLCSISSYFPYESLAKFQCELDERIKCGVVTRVFGTHSCFFSAL